MSQQLRDRLRPKQKLKFDSETLSEIPYINTDMPLDIKVALVRENKIIDHIIKNLLADNDKYYIKHEEESNTFKILEDSQQKDRDRLFELILNTEKKN